MDTRQRLIEMADGSYVEQDVLNIVQKIREYDDKLRVKYLDPSRAEFGDAPYRIVELCPDGIERVVFGVWELNETVLERIYAADNLRGNVLLTLDANNDLARLGEKRRYQEKMDEAKDIVEHYLASRKGRYSFVDPETENKITIDDQEGIPAKVERSGKDVSI